MAIEAFSNLSMTVSDGGTVPSLDYLSNKTLYKITFPAFWETAYKDKNAFFRKVEQCAKEHVERTSRGHEFLEGENSGKEYKFFRIRGWGMLTGSGGYNLDAETAAQVQDDFMEYCINQLNG